MSTGRKATALGLLVAVLALLLGPVAPAAAVEGQGRTHGLIFSSNCNVNAVYDWPAEDVTVKYSAICKGSFAQMTGDSDMTVLFRGRVGGPAGAACYYGDVVPRGTTGFERTGFLSLGWRMQWAGTTEASDAGTDCRVEQARIVWGESELDEMFTHWANGLIPDLATTFDLALGEPTPNESIPWDADPLWTGVDGPSTPWEYGEGSASFSWTAPASIWGDKSLILCTVPPPSGITWQTADSWFNGGTNPAYGPYTRRGVCNGTTPGATNNQGVYVDSSTSNLGDISTSATSCDSTSCSYTANVPASTLAGVTVYWGFILTTGYNQHVIRALWIPQDRDVAPTVSTPDEPPAIDPADDGPDGVPGTDDDLNSDGPASDGDCGGFPGWNPLAWISALKCLLVWAFVPDDLGQRFTDFRGDLAGSQPWALILSGPVAIAAAVEGFQDGLNGDPLQANSVAGGSSCGGGGSDAVGLPTVGLNPWCALSGDDGEGAFTVDKMRSIAAAGLWLVFIWACYHRAQSIIGVRSPPAQVEVDVPT